MTDKSFSGWLEKKNIHPQWCESFAREGLYTFERNIYKMVDGRYRHYIFIYYERPDGEFGCISDARASLHRKFKP